MPARLGSQPTCVTSTQRAELYLSPQPQGSRIKNSFLGEQAGGEDRAL